MSRQLEFLSVDDVLAIHRRMIDEFGGEPGLRDRGLLESAVAMPAAWFGGKHLHREPDGMAAAYLFHLCRNHAFIDGNERTALAAAEVFVRLNGYKLAASDKELETITTGVAEGSISKDQAVEFFRKHVKKQGRGKRAR